MAPASTRRDRTRSRTALRSAAWRRKPGRGALRDPGRRALERALARRSPGSSRSPRAPERLDDDDAVDALRRLQYRLHVASEYGRSASRRRSTPNRPTPSSRAALDGARDATGEVVEAVDAARRRRGRRAPPRVARRALPRSPRPAAAHRRPGRPAAEPSEHPEAPRARSPPSRSRSAARPRSPIGATVGPLAASGSPGWSRSALSLLLYRP